MGWSITGALLRGRHYLEAYLDTLSRNPPSARWPPEAQLAYWINAYNAFTVKLIIDHYPLQSIKDIGGGIAMVNSPWDIKFFKIGGIDFDLNTIEHKILRVKFDEARIHFAINCASISCPRLRREAYLADQLEQQLEDQARQFINDPGKNIITKTEARLSPIFDWFRSDFTRGQSLPDFLQKYTQQRLSPGLAIQYLEYDWALNERRAN
ncbi:MAG: DUF547 domain-containing protein [Bacteroidia bacterium]|nr:DUF547 domain-containing protein [Bacteroidia bacterium]